LVAGEVETEHPGQDAELRPSSHDLKWELGARLISWRQREPRWLVDDRAKRAAIRSTGEQDRAVAGIDRVRGVLHRETSLLEYPNLSSTSHDGQHGCADVDAAELATSIMSV